MIWDRIKIHRWCISGLPVIYCQLPFCGTVYMSYYVAAGSFAEGAQHGLAHCVEHMLVRRSEKRTPGRLHLDIGLLGANNNAFTYTYRTSFFLEVVPGNTRKALKLLNEMIWFPCFKKMDWSKERKVIFEEMEGLEDNPLSTFFDRADEGLFNNQAGHSLTGTPEQVQSYSIEDIESFYRKYYGRNNSTLVIVGSLPEEEVKEACLISMDGIRAPVVQPVPVEKPLLAVGRNISLRRKGQRQCYILLTMRAPGLMQEGNPAHFCALQALGGDIWSILFKRAREKLGLCYSISAFSHHINQHEGSSLITAECSKANVKKVISCIHSCVEDMGEGKLSRNLCGAAKAVAEMQMHEMLSSPESLGDFIGGRAVFGVGADPSRSYKALKAVTAEGIRGSATEWCHETISQATLT